MSKQSLWNYTSLLDKKTELSRSTQSRRLSISSVTRRNSRAAEAKKVVVSFDRAKIYTYNASSPVHESRSYNSLRKVDSVDSIRSITEIMSPKDESSSMGRLVCHGVFQIYELEGGIYFLSCGGGEQTTRETFVHPLLLRLKTFKVNNSTFILALLHPERFWKICLQLEEPENEYLAKVRRLEEVFRQLCCFYDMFPGSITEDQEQQEKQDIDYAHAALLERSDPQIQEQLDEKRDYRVEESKNKSRRQKTHLSNRLSKLFKGKKKTLEDLDLSKFKALSLEPSPVNHTKQESQRQNSIVKPQHPIQARPLNGVTAPSSIEPANSVNSGSPLNTLSETQASVLKNSEYIEKMIDEKVDKVRNEFKRPVRKSSSSLLLEIIEETARSNDLQNPEILGELTSQLNNEVNEEILMNKEKQVASEFHREDDIVEHFRKSSQRTSQRRSSAYVTNSSKNWLEPTEVGYRQYYRPYARTEYDARSTYSTKTYAYKNSRPEDNRSVYSLFARQNTGKSKEIYNIITDQEPEDLKTTNRSLLDRMLGW